MIDTAPCKDCADRYVGCHDTCERYRIACEELDRRKKAKREAESIFWADVRRQRRRRYG